LAANDKTSLPRCFKQRPQPRKPRPDQLRAITAAKKHFIRNKETRGRLIMPCGTGKSLIAFGIAEALKANTIVVAVPSLGLIRQSVTDWTREFLAKGQKPDWICVCSDDSVTEARLIISTRDAIGTLIHAKTSRAGQTCFLPSVRTPLPLR
jgi:predicted helicase